MISLNVCLSDIPKEKMKKHENGKVYVNLIVSKRKEIGQYGETHILAVSRTKEEREQETETIYCGNGKEFLPVAVTAENIENMPPINEGDLSDLPF